MTESEATEVRYISPNLIDIRFIMVTDMLIFAGWSKVPILGSARTRSIGKALQPY
jgi:hypothetical protein